VEDTCVALIICKLYGGQVEEKPKIFRMPAIANAHMLNCRAKLQEMCSFIL